MKDPVLLKLKRRLDRWELPHLRAHAAELAERLEAAEKRANDADRSAEFWHEEVMSLQEQLANEAPARTLGMTPDGSLHILTQGGAS